MPLQFNPYPLEPWLRKQEADAEPDFNQTVTQPLMQGLQMMQQSKDQERQNQLQELLLKYKMTGEDRAQQEHAYKFGNPISPDAMEGTPTGQVARSSFMPGGQGQVGTGGSILDQFNKWRSGGMKKEGARPEFMGALGQDERKLFQDRANPEPTELISPSVAKSLGLPADLIAQYPNGIPRQIASLSNSFSTRQNAVSNQEFGNENQLQTKFLSESKDFKETATSYQRIIDSAKDPSAAGDLALIFNYMKMLDPGSTVREGEFANAQNSGGVPDIIAAKYNQVLKGERLSSDIRSDFMNRSTSLYKGQEERHRQREEEFKRIAQGYRMDPSRIIVDLRAKPKAQGQAISEAGGLPQGGGSSSGSSDQEAVQWALSNRTDPRAIQILRINGRM